MKYQITHRTQYRYQQDTANCYNLACMLPRAMSYQKVESSRLQVNPAPSSQYQSRDFFGNQQTFFHIGALHSQLEVTVVSQVEAMRRYVAGPLESSMPWDDLTRHLAQSTYDAALDARLFSHGTRMTPCDPLLAEFARQDFKPGVPVLEAARRLAHRIFEEFTFEPGFTTLATPVRTVLETKRGVCQDFAQLAISALRSLGLPVRYVSGYLETLPPPGQARLVGADASHAWFSVFDPVLGWIDFDPTNDMMPDERHITVAFGRDYADVVPLKGLMSGGGEHQLKVEVDVMPLGLDGAPLS